MRTFEESSILKKVQKWTKGVLALYIGYIFVAPLAIRPFVDENVQSYVTKELGSVMLAQEQKFGIHYSSLPTIKFEKHSSTSFLQSLFVAGVTQGNTVYLSPGLVETPEDNLINLIVSLLNFGISENVKGTLDHELGHIYHNQLNKSLGSEGNLAFSGTNSLEDTIAIRFTSEGIGTYFEKTMNKGIDKFQDSDYPSVPKNYLSVYILYEGGFHFVKPIIDQHGKKGIEYLVRSPPLGRDLHDIKAYQRKVLHDLSNPKSLGW